MSITEQINPQTTELDRLPTLEALRLINAEDREVAEAVERVLPAVARAVDETAARLEQGGRLIYVGTGTSGRLGVLDASECPPTFGVSPELVQGIIAGGYEACYRAVEASEDDRAAGARDLEARGVGERDAVVGLTASGRTPYTLGAVEYARRCGALTIGITCNPDTELERTVELAIIPIVGPEVIAGSTRLKSGTAQKLVLNMLSTMAMVRLGYVSGNRMSNLQARNTKLRQRAVAIVAAECGMNETGARTTLEEADWELPLALVMCKTRAARGVAAEALRQTHFSIARAIDLIKNAGA